MIKAELLEIIANGENSGVECKRDDIRPEQFAKEIVAFAKVQAFEATDDYLKTVLLRKKSDG
jgi:hypothetical protein